MSHDTHDHHSNAVPKESISSEHAHLAVNAYNSMMQMYFHRGFIETILFKSWSTTSVSLFIGSWIFIFILGVLYEGIRELRQYLEVEERIIQTEFNGNENELQQMNTETPESTPRRNKKTTLRYPKRVLHTLLYIIYLSFSYILMLIVMTFNTYLFLAVIFGLGTGHLLFRQISYMTIN